ncbi:hypothetical protein [Actinomadura rugatobispora]|uniref:Cell wall-active antibiotics response LiaF-like C-terminal domain-containing protein n=1 Tax=Actinomadura rugatobispora TaxID=1994 RepID=A0ABW1A4W5_9ACTN|nr:hypothetical protein GCM10010200_039290 [Actinomadura rugatobispora]
MSEIQAQTGPNAGREDERAEVTAEGVRAARVRVPGPGRPDATARLSFDNGLDRLALSARAGLGGLLEADFGDPVPTVWSVDGRTHVEYPLGSRLFRRPAPGTVRIDPGSPWSVDVHGGAARLEADFTGVDLRSLAFHSGVAHVTITLGRPRGTRVVRLASADDLTILRPPGVPVRIEAAKGLTKVTLDGRSFGAVGNGLTDETPGYGTTEDRYLILISGGVSGLTLTETDS